MDGFEGSSIDVCTNQITIVAGSGRHLGTHRVRSRLLGRQIVHPSPSASSPEVRVRGMLTDRSSRLRLHALSDLRHVRHETQRSRIDRIDLPLGTTHARLSTNACATDWDPMISFAEHRSLSEKLRFPESTQPLAGSLHLDRCFTPLMCRAERQPNLLQQPMRSLAAEAVGGGQRGSGNRPHAQCAN